MKINLSFTTEKYQSVTTVRGLTAAKLIESRVSETRDQMEQISEIQWKQKILTVFWTLREDADDLGHACALGWDMRSEAASVEIGLATFLGADSVNCVQENEALKIT